MINQLFGHYASYKLFFIFYNLNNPQNINMMTHNSFFHFLKIKNDDVRTKFILLAFFNFFCSLFYHSKLAKKYIFFVLCSEISIFSPKFFLIYSIYPK